MIVCHPFEPLAAHQVILSFTMKALPFYSSTYGLPSRIDNTCCCSRPTVHTHPNVKVLLHCGFNHVRRILMVFYITWKPEVKVNHKGSSQTSVSVSSGIIPAWIVLVYASYKLHYACLQG